MPLLSQICLVVDFEGFSLRKGFYIREFGYAALTKGFELESYRFRLNHLAGNLDDGDWKGVRFGTKRIHGLSFRALPGEKLLFDVENLDQLLINAYRRSKTPTEYLVAYKGGHFERDVLDRLDIPSVNLEDFGCPKFNDLPQKKRDLTCGYHRKADENVKVHCPKEECAAFAEWILDNV